MSLFIQALFLTFPSSVVATKSCHCNGFFRLKTKLALRLHHYIPRCPYYTTFYAFRRTGVHPPYTILSK